MCIHHVRDSFLEEWPQSDSVDYEPATVTHTDSLNHHPSFPYTAFFLQHEGSECLIIPDNHFCISCQYSVRFMWKCTACISRAPYGLARCSPLPVPLCDGLSCSAASGSERGIITPCPSAGSFLGPVRITWTMQSVRWAPTQYSRPCYQLKPAEASQCQH